MYTTTTTIQVYRLHVLLVPIEPPILRLSQSQIIETHVFLRSGCMEPAGIHPWIERAKSRPVETNSIILIILDHSVVFRTCR